MHVDTLGASLSRNMLAGKGVMIAGEGTVRIGYVMYLRDLHLKRIFDSTTPFNKL